MLIRGFTCHVSCAYKERYFTRVKMSLLGALGEVTRFSE